MQLVRDGAGLLLACRQLFHEALAYVDTFVHVTFEVCLNTKSIYHAIGPKIRSIETIQATGDNRALKERTSENPFLIHPYFDFPTLRYVEVHVKWVDVKGKQLTRDFCNELRHLQVVKCIKDVALGLSHTIGEEILSYSR